MVFWSSDNPNQSSLTEIANWWAGLEGQTIQWVQVHGSLTNSVTGESKVHMQTTEGDSFDLNDPVFTLQNPTLQDAKLTFRGVYGFQELQIQQLQLDTQNQQLQVICPTGRVHTFTLRTTVGGFKIESMSF
jgi:hypothetical protein